MLGIGFGICFLTGLLSYYQYAPWSWLPTPTAPVWGYRVTQGLHVTTGIACIPLIFVKLWSVYPNFFRWPPFPSIKRTIERVSLALLISSSLLQLFTGFFNVLGWYPFRWDFIVVHYALAWVVIGSLLLHVGIKLPDIVYGLRAKLPEADVLTEIPWNENPDSHSIAGDLPAPPTPGLSRRGVLAVVGAGLGVVVVGTVGQTLTPLERIGLLAPRQPSRGPLGLPVSKTAAEAQVGELPSDWRLEVAGPQPYALSPGRGRGAGGGRGAAALRRERGLERHGELARGATARSGPTSRGHGRFTGQGAVAGSRAGRSTSRSSRANSCPARCWPPISTGSGSPRITGTRCG